VRLARALRRGGEYLASVAAARMVALEAGRRLSISAAVDFVYEFGLPGFDVTLEPIQVRSELLRFAEIVGRGDGRPPRAILEIGTARGGTLFLLASVAADDALILSVDLPSGPFGGGYSSRRARIYKSFARDGQTIRLHRADSHDPSMIELVRVDLRERSLDLLLIDGDHGREGVLSDLRMYSPFVRQGGLIALHDIVSGDSGKVGGVPDVWAELRMSHEVEEIVEDWEQGGYGIGVVRKDTPAGEPLGREPSL
jgi:cephalosporin hydroxylase